MARTSTAALTRASEASHIQPAGVTVRFPARSTVPAWVWHLADILTARPWLAPRLAAHFGRMQAAIHRLRAPTALRDRDRDWIHWAGPIPERLDAHLRRGNADTLLHLDYHPLNVLATVGGTRITAVLDWANAGVGDPRADVARTRTILRLDAADRRERRPPCAPCACSSGAGGTATSVRALPAIQMT